MVQCGRQVTRKKLQIYNLHTVTYIYTVTYGAEKKDLTKNV